MSAEHPQWLSFVPGPEILITLMLIGTLASFFLPKVFRQVRNVEVSKVREAVSMLEETYIQSRNVYSLQEYTPLYANVSQQLNPLIQSDASVDEPGAPLHQVLDKDGNPHPCAARSVGSKRGWLVLHNGLILSGLNSQPRLGDGTTRPAAASTQHYIYLICVDANGAKGPNLEGSDVFWGNFQHNDEGGAFRWGREQKWVWGAPGQYLVKEDGFTNLGNPSGSDIADLLEKR